jgi:uncharacterized membrane protein
MPRENGRMTMTGAAANISTINVNSIGYDAPWTWLDQGFQDFKRCPGISLAYGFAALGVSLLLTTGLWFAGLGAWILPLCVGFMIVGPIFAVGLYEASRRLARGEPVSLEGVMRLNNGAFRRLTYMGLMLALIYFAWLEVAMLLYAVFANGQYYPFSQFITHLLTTTNGMALAGVGTAIGAAIAFAAFAVSAVSIPMLLSQDVDVATAVLTSVAAVRRNPGPMLLWAWIIAAFVGLAMLMGFVGLAFVFPLIGHASWHAYRSLVPSSG